MIANRSTTRQPPAIERHGFVLLLVLWLVFGVSAVALALNALGRDAVATARNRILLARATWIADGCIERARAAIGDALISTPDVDSAWRSLDDVVRASPIIGDCDLNVRPAGDALNVNAATADELQSLFLASGMPGERADSLADAILDWRDADDDARPLGAEGAWYRARGLMPPRNAAFAAREEILRVRGVGATPHVESLLDIEPGRIVLDRAPLAVLAAMPGFGAEALGLVAERRQRRNRRGDLLQFSEGLQPDARAAFLAHYAELTRLVTLSPDAWIFTDDASIGSPPITARVEVRLTRGGRRAAVIRRRSWP